MALSFELPVRDDLGLTKISLRGKERVSDVLNEAHAPQGSVLISQSGCVYAPDEPLKALSSEEGREMRISRRLSAG